jgi:PAS domain S-box-containing protein
MELIDSLKTRLKEVSQELAGHKIELHQAIGYLQSILQKSNDMIFAADVDGILLSFSKGGEKVLGYSSEDVAGTLVKNLAINPSAFEKLMATTQEEGNSVRLDVPFRHKDGNTIHCDVSLIGLTNTMGQKVGTVAICRDITLWKKLQEDLIRVDRLAEIGRIASGIAHEINNPLAVINEIAGWAGTLVSDAGGLSREDRVELETAVKRISEQTGRCSSITHQLLDFARDSAPAKRSLDIHQLLNETIGFLKPDLKFKNIEIVPIFEEGLFEIQSDPKLLEQVFINLLSNAIYAIKQKGTCQGRIEIRTSKPGTNVEIVISDNGTGIPDEDREKIFDLFYTTKPTGKGTGLGMPICQNIVNKLGGDIIFESRVGEGTTFTVRIPVL